MTFRSRQDVIRPVPFPRGVATPDGVSGFIGRSTAGVAAVDLASGADLWQVTHPARPRLVVGDRLVAQDLGEPRANALRFILLDLTRRGRVVLTLGPIVLPDWVSVADPEQVFTFETYAADSELGVDWQAESIYRGGAPPPSHVQIQARHVAHGQVRLSLATGDVVAERADTGPLAREVAAPLLAVTSAPYLRDLSWHDAPWVADSMGAALVKIDVAGQNQMQLRRWELSNGGELMPVRLATGDASVAEVTPDGRFLFVRREHGGVDAAAHAPWLVFSVMSGQSIGQVPYEEGASGPCVVHGRVFYLVESTRASTASGATLKAFDPTSGKELWKKDVPGLPAAAPSRLRM